MPFNLRLYSGVACILFAFICSVVHFRRSGRAARLLSVFLGATLLTEAVAAYCNLRYHFNLHVYNIMGPVMMLFSSLYFNYSNARLQRKGIGWYVGAGGFVFTVINLVFFEPLDTLNSNFAALECVCMCAFALAYFHSLYYKGYGYRLARDPHFWIAFLFLVFYAGTFMARAGIEILKHYATDGKLSFRVYHIVFALALIFYTGIGIVFLKFKKIRDD